MRLESTLHRMIAAATAAALYALSPMSAAAPPLEAYGRLPGIELVELSPSGERIALVGAVKETRRVLLITADHKLLRNEAVGTAKVRNLTWVGEDHVLVTVTSTVDAILEFGHSYELAAMYNIGLSGAPSQVFHDTPGIEHFVNGYFGAALKDGHWSGYFGGVTETRGANNEYYFSHGYRDLYRVDLDTGRTSLEAKGSEYDHDWVLAPDGTVVAHSEYQKSSGQWRLFAGAFRDKLLLTKTSPTREIYLAGQGRSPGTVVVRDTLGDAEHIAEISTVDGSAAALFAGTAVANLIFDRGSLLLLGAMARERPKVVLFDHGLQERYDTAVHAFPGKIVALDSYDRDFHKIVLETEGSRDSGTYWLVDLNTDRAEPLGYPHPDIAEGEVAESRVIRYTAADGLELFGILTLPPGRAPQDLPLIVLPHGGPLGVHDDPGFDWWSQAFASRGYAVFQPNYRGSGGRGLEFLRAGFGQWGGKMLTDIADGTVELARQNIIDPKRVCIVGGSYGGYAALAGVTLQHGLYRCAVSVAGLSQLPIMDSWQNSYYGGSNSTQYRNWRRVTGADTGGSGALRAISPAFFAAQADAPILLIHGKDDTRVPMEQSEAMASALKHAGKPYEFVTLEHEDHFLSREATRTAMLKAAVAFVEKYDPPQ